MREGTHFGMSPYSVVPALYWMVCHVNESTLDEINSDRFRAVQHTLL